jgi:alkyldihydroxyacetonephosphate synthase
MANKMKQMKWWGWGSDQVTFDIENRPNLWPFITRVLGVAETLNKTSPVNFSNVTLPNKNINNPFLDVIQKKINSNQIFMDDKERLLHAYGKSYRDLWRVRQGIVSSAPDVVIYPESEEDVSNVIRLANDYNVVVIPFGGGSNIVGCLEAKDTLRRMVVSLDMKRMHKVLHLDKESGMATIQAGVMGPQLEQQLNQAGVTLGHFPDSFEYSTLGGWVATRSAGMQSDQYGKIEDMVIALRMVTPSGTIVTRKVPKCSNGININHLCIGSEGIFGVITEVTVQVHTIPEKKDYFGYLFPTFEQGVAAIYQCVREKCLPVVTRLNDADKTALSFAYKTKSSKLKQWLSSVIKKYLRLKGFDLENCCLMITSIEGSKKNFKSSKSKMANIFRQHGGVSLGAAPGRSFEKSKYDFPYLRDFVMDYDVMADVSETATSWSNLLPLYYAVKKAIKTSITETGSTPWVGCHISHNYHSGASLYFTFACKHRAEQQLQQYLAIKKAAEDAFLNNGATLSHHHAVGYEHIPWIEKDISAAGIKAITALKQGLDVSNIMNPGKIIPTAQTMADWMPRENNNTDKLKAEELAYVHE